MPVFIFEGLSVHYDVSGEGPAVLFMHGLAAERGQAQQTLASENNNQLITLDMPGHGETHANAGGPSSDLTGFEIYSRIALSLLNHLNIDRAILGGISMGSGIALHMALAQPKRALGLFLVRPAWLAQPARPHLNVIAQLGRLLGETTPEKAAKALAGDAEFQELFSGIPSAADSVLNAAKHRQISENPNVLSELVDDQPFGRLEDLAGINCPALVLGNNADPLHPPRIARIIAGSLPKGRYAHLPPRYLEAEAHGAALLTHFHSFLSAHSTALAHSS
ncbi:alpha/beta fold hydrolase [Pararhizobium sp. IMCC21322]|uniref:alpha/beta fold hydrolase n=1 Tax=Pararhizobium sp. IMCC21322 TaxID=3067903 RepID=UPI0027404BD2|nr:alpha/beta hydrolase [Pararhizobium sp. IMCC21322]